MYYRYVKFKAPLFKIDTFGLGVLAYDEPLNHFYIEWLTKNGSIVIFQYTSDWHEIEYLS